MKYINHAYIGFAAIMIMAFGFYISEIWRYEDGRTVYEGYIIEGFELSEFVSCAPLDNGFDDGYSEYLAAYRFDDNTNFWSTYGHYFAKEYEPVYIRAVGALLDEENHGFGCCSTFPDTVHFVEILDVSRAAEAPCEPPIPIRFRQIQTSYGLNKSLQPTAFGVG